MFAPQDLVMVHRRQDELRRQAKHDRLAASLARHGKHDRKALRVFGLRLSLA